MPHHDMQSVGALLEILHEEVLSLHRKVHQMQVDISKLTSAEQALIGVVEQVLVVVGNQQTALATLSAQLAAAIAANDPVGNVALQSAIDTMAKTLADETTKVGTALAAATPIQSSTSPAPATAPAPAAVEATPPSTATPTLGSTGVSGPQETGPVASDPAPTTTPVSSADPHAPAAPPTEPPPAS